MSEESLRILMEAIANANKDLEVAKEKPPKQTQEIDRNEGTKAQPQPRVVEFELPSIDWDAVDHENLGLISSTYHSPEILENL